MIAGSAVSNLLAGRAARQGYVTVVDQALVSGTGFATNILMARLGGTEFGAFVLAFTAMMFANALQAALVTGPLSVLGAKRDGKDFRQYLASTAILQASLALAVATLVLLAAIAASLVREPRAALVWALVPAVLAWQAQEFARRVLFSRGKPGAVLANDALTYGGQLLGIALLYKLGLLTGPLAFTVIAAVNALGAAFGAWQLREYRRGWAGASLGRGLAENWSFARWTLAGSLTQWTSEQVYPFLTGGFLGIEAPGIYKALQNIVALSYVIGFAMDSVLTPRAANAYATGGPSALRSFIGKVYLTTTPVGLGFLALVAALAGPALNLLYADRYDGYAGMLAFMTITYALLFLHRPLAMGLRAQEITKPLFTGYVLSTGVTFTVGLVLIREYGLWGAQWGGLLNIIVLLAVLVLAWRRSPAGGGA